MPTLAPVFHFERRNLSEEQLRHLYRAMLYPRLIEEKMLILLRQGRVSKWFSGMGQEAVAVGVTQALEKEDYLLPLHRNLGVFTGRDIPLSQLIEQWQGKAGGFTHGRDRSFHFGSPAHRIIGMISHLGAMLPVADGLALGAKLDDKAELAAVFSGDGGSSEGDFHEALNLASVWDLPVLFVVENNGYGLSTPSAQQFRCQHLADRAAGYGMEGYTIDGNNILEVYQVVKALATQMRQNRRPVLLECLTFRMRGHEEASGTKYVPNELLEAWGAKDPIANYESFLLQEGVLSEAQVAEIRQELKLHINAEVETGFAGEAIQADAATELQAVYAPFSGPWVAPPETDARDLRFVDAVSEGLAQAMEQHPGLVLMGQDIADYGGVFKVTAGLMDRFGAERVRNTPICESVIIGAAMGLSLTGKKAMVEMQFADFVSCGFNQIVNNLAKTHYRWGHAPDVVLRLPTGAGAGAGPFHSQSNESWFTHTPGLKVVYPATPADAKGLLLAAFTDPNPVLYFEHKLLYRSVSGPVPEAYYHVPIGKARVARPGTDLSIITYGMGVHWALQAAAFAKGKIEVIDLRTLLPWDQETVFASVRKTGKCLVLHEDTYTGAFGAEVAAAIGEHCFQWLDAPVTRLGALDTPVPFHTDLEKVFLPAGRLADALEKLLAY